MFAFLYVRVNSREICEEISFPSCFRKNFDVSIFVEIQGWLSRKNAWLPIFFFVDSNSPCKDLLFPRGPNLAQKPLYLVGTVLKTQFTPRWQSSDNLWPLVTLILETSALLGIPWSWTVGRPPKINARTKKISCFSGYNFYGEEPKLTFLQVCKELISSIYVPRKTGKNNGGICKMIKKSCENKE